MKINALIAFTALWASRPGLGASAEQVAAWYHAKGRTHEALAAQARTPAEQVEALTNAAAAYEHARRLLVDVSPRPAGTEADAVALDARADTARRAAELGVGVSP